MLRFATPADYLSWKKIYTQSSVNPFMYYDFNEHEMFELPSFLKLINEKTLYIYHNEKNETIGICKLIPEPDAEHVITISSVAIDEAHRNQRHGRRMLQELHAEILQNYSHIKRIQLGVESDNPNARKIYESLGFKSEGYFFDWFKRLSGLLQHNWYAREEFMAIVMIPDQKIQPIKITGLPQSTVNIADSVLRKATAEDAKDAYELYRQAQMCREGFEIKSYDLFLEKFQLWLSQGDCYVYAIAKKILGLCHLTKYHYLRLQHNVEINTLLVHPQYNSPITTNMLHDIIMDQSKKSDVKRIELTLLEGEDVLLQGCCAAGFLVTATLRGAIKHPQENYYINKNLLEFNLFGIKEAEEYIANVNVSEKKKQVLKKQFLTICNDFKNPSRETVEEIKAQHAIYQQIKERN